MDNDGRIRVSYMNIPPGKASSPHPTPHDTTPTSISSAPLSSFPFRMSGPPESPFHLCKKDAVVTKSESEISSTNRLRSMTIMMNPKTKQNDLSVSHLT